MIHALVRTCVLLLAAIGAAVCVAVLLLALSQPGSWSATAHAWRPSWSLPDPLPWRTILIVGAGVVGLLFRWTRPLMRIALPLVLLGSAFTGLSGNRAGTPLALPVTIPTAPPTTDTWPAFRDAAQRVQKQILPSVPQLFDK